MENKQYSKKDLAFTSKRDEKDISDTEIEKYNDYMGRD